MLEKKVTPVSVGKDKLKNGNLKRNKEATHDVCVGYGIAAVLEFKASPFFPKPEKIDEVSDPSNLL